MAKCSSFQTKFRLWVYAGDEKLPSPGRVEIMEHIHPTGSIQKAALEMGMPYHLPSAAYPPHKIAYKD